MIKVVIIVLGSKVVSTVIDLNSANSLIKCFADNGYILSTDSSEIIKKITNENSAVKNFSAINKIISWIPIINIMNSCKHNMVIKQKMSQALTASTVVGVVDRMTPEEEEEYRKKPSTTTAMLLYVKRKQQLDNAKTINLMDIEDIKEEGTITYVADSVEEIKILESTGYASMLTSDKKKAIITKLLSNDNNKETSNDTEKTITDSVKIRQSEENTNVNKVTIKINVRTRKK